ncbi:MAG TPA: hypothetical protein VL461_10210 [Dictyobacter sp.]|nr:hypothetical protein [Dictyobacter sp.]
MCETLAKDRLAMSQPFFGKQDFPPELLPVQTTNILKLDSFEQIPDAFLRVEFWGVRVVLQE